MEEAAEQLCIGKRSLRFLKCGDFKVDRKGAWLESRPLLRDRLKQQAVGRRTFILQQRKTTGKRSRFSQPG